MLGDAEAAQAAAERQHAEAESQRAEAQAAKAEAESRRAEAESARANEESKRRRTSLALAAPVLLLISLGSGGWLYMERQESNRQTAEANAQRQHAAEMQTLAEQRDVQRKAAEQQKSIANNKERETRDAQQNAEEIARMMISFFESGDLMGFTSRSVASGPGEGGDAISGFLGHVKPLLLQDETFAGNPFFRAGLLISAGASCLRTPDKTWVAALCREWSRCREERRGDKCRRGSMTPQIGRYRRNPAGRLCLCLRRRRSSSTGCPVSSSPSI